MGIEADKNSVQKKISHPLSENEMEEGNEKESINYASAKVGSFHIKKEHYIGLLIGGKKEGKGTCFYKNGDKYEGNFKDDKKEGKGTYMYNEKGEMYQGNFTNDYPNGMGKYFFKNGDRYEGMFKDGKKHGEGTLIYSKGGKYKGEFRNDQKHGKGEYKNELGQITYEYWDNGVLKPNNENEFINESESVSLFNETNTKKFEEFLIGTYRKKAIDKTPLLNKIKQIKEKSKNKINDQQLVQLLNFVTNKPNVKFWTVDDVKMLFQKIEFEKYISYIETNSIDGKKLLLLDNASIYNIFKLTDKNETKIMVLLIEFIADIYNNEHKIENNLSRKNVILINNIGDNNNVINNSLFNKNEKKELKKYETVKNVLNLDIIKEIEKEKEKDKEKDTEKEKEKEKEKGKGKVKIKEEEEKKEIKSNDDDSKKEYLSQYKDDFIKELNKLGKTEFYSSLNNDSMNFFVNYDEIKKLTKVVGEGGMGIVKLGELQGKKVTLKESKLKYNRNGNIFVSKTFINEINIIASLRHPNIVLFMGVTIDDNLYYMISEYVEGGSLNKYIHSKKNYLTEPQKIKISLQIALAIKYIHSKNILHCDLKSENIFLDENFNAKLGDFGFSYIMSKEAKSAVGGTYRWMAPEILINNEKYEKTADIFSYGLILWEILTGKAPYYNLVIDKKHPDSKQPYVNYIKQRVQNHQSIMPIPKKGNIVLRYITSKCLEYKPEDRISMDDILTYLTKANKCYEEVDKVILEMYNFVS